MWFGNIKGTRMKDLPASYLRWALKQKDPGPDLAYVVAYASIQPPSTDLEEGRPPVPQRSGPSWAEPSQASSSRSSQPTSSQAAASQALPQRRAQDIYTATSDWDTTGERDTVRMETEDGSGETSSVCSD